MSFLSRILGVVDRTYLVRAYAIGFAISGGFMYMAMQSPEWTGFRFDNFAYFALSILLFPFSKLVYDELKRVALGNNVLVMNAMVMLVAKLLINVTLFGAAMFIAPVGVLYLWLRSRSQA